MHSWPVARECESGWSTKGVRSVRVARFSREAVALVLVGLAGLAWYLEAQPIRPEARPWLVRGAAKSQIWSFALSPDGKTMATIDTTGGVVLRAARSGWAIERTLLFGGYPRALAFSADSRFLACGGLSTGITLYDLASDAAARTLAVPVDRVRAIAFAPDGRTLAVVDEGSTTIVLWGLVAGRVLRTLHASGRVHSIAFAPDSRHLASGVSDRIASIVLWDLDTGMGRVLCQETCGAIRPLAFSPDGTLLAAAGAWERYVRTWDLSAAKPGPLIEGHRLGTNGLAFSPDGMTLATAGCDGTVRLWTVATGREQAVLEGGGLAMGPVAFSGSNCLVATARNDDDIRVWNLAELGPTALPDHPLARTTASTAPDSRSEGIPSGVFGGSTLRNRAEGRVFLKASSMGTGGIAQVQESR
jgi:WD40 repeat protein